MGGALPIPKPFQEKALPALPLVTAPATAGPPTTVHARIAAFPWGDTPLGPRTGWPAALETALRLCLASPVPTAIWWGPELIQLHNDAFAEAFGGRDAAMLGRPAPAAWGERWASLAPHVARALAGQTVRSEGPEHGPSFVPLVGQGGGAAGVWHSLGDVAAARDAFLNEAGTLLLDSLDYEATLARVAALAVPRMADLCEIALAEEDGTLRRVALARGELSGAGLLDETEARRVLTRGRAEVSATASRIVVPMTAGGRGMGVLLLAGAGGGRRLGHADLPMAERLAWKVALSIVHAQAVEALGRAEERYRALTHAVPALLFSNRPDGFCDYVNEFWRDFTGNADAAGERWLEAVHPDDRQRARARWMASVTTGTDFHNEFRLRRRDGTFRWLRVQGMPVRDADGRIARWFGVGVDVHDQREAEEAVRRAQKLESIGVLAGGIAHDFNNLLTGILGNASLALRSLPPGTPVAEMIGDVVKASERAAGLTSQLLAYAGKSRFTVVPVDLGRLVRELADLLRASLPKKVAVEVELEAGLAPVEADPSQLQQVIMNLVINGAEAIGDRPGAVRLRVSSMALDEEEISARFAGFALEPGPCLRIEVIDNGCGMDPGTVGRIFDPFFSTKFVGRGLGLAATLGIVRGHRGGIAVESRPGQGSRFTLVLPTSRAAAGSDPARPDSASRRGHELVLVVDDEELVRRTARGALADAGYRVVEAEDGVDALGAFRRYGGEIAAVLLDMTMPLMTGDEAVRHIRRTYPSTLIIASSGFGELETNRRFAGTGVDACLQKPYSSEQLLDLLGRLLAASGR